MILLLGGTSDSLVIANELLDRNMEMILSTATDYGEKIARKSYTGRIVSGKKDRQQLENFCVEHKVTHIVDATHPYAKDISKNAMDVAGLLRLEYLRYERPIITDDHKDIQYCESYEEAGQIANESVGNIFLTTGSNQVECIVDRIDDLSRVYARVLPHSDSIRKLELLGLLPKQIVAIKGPFSIELNKALFTKTNAKILISKQSGTSGKVEEKIQAAKEMGMKMILIKRPQIDYPAIYHSITTIVQACLMVEKDNE